MSARADLERELRAAPRLWALSGVAGFVGSHLLERLLGLGQRVRGLDDFSTGRRAHLEAVRERVGPERWRAFELLEGDVRDPGRSAALCEGAAALLHQAGQGSVPRSLAEPERALAVNTGGTWTVQCAARAAGVRRAVLASSSSVYGDSAASPQSEDELGTPLSPYAASKRAAELVAEGLARSGGSATVALRYFNVFGPRQDPDGPYAAVIPRWSRLLALGRAPVLEGDGTQTRDFTPVRAVVDANLLAATVPLAEPFAVVNVGRGREVALAELLEELRAVAAELGLARAPEAQHAPARPGDRPSSRADLARASALLGLEPPRDPGAELREGLRAVVGQLVDSRLPAS